MAMAPRKCTKTFDGGQSLRLTENIDFWIILLLFIQLYHHLLYRIVRSCASESYYFEAQLEQLGVYLVRCDGVDQRTQLLDITGSFGVGLLPVTFASRSW